MSEHSTLSKFTTVKGVEHEVDVLMGWDRPLQRHFLTVVILDPDTELSLEDLPESLQETSNVDEGIVYSNLCDKASVMDLVYFQNKLSELGVRVPESMITGCKVDQERNAGNEETFHEFPDTE